MVEQAAAGEMPSSPQPPEAGARRVRLYGVLSAVENRNRQTMPSSRHGAACGMWQLEPASADFESVADLPLAARGGPEQNFVVLQGQAVGNRPLFASGEDLGEVIAGR